MHDAQRDVLLLEGRTRDGLLAEEGREALTVRLELLLDLPHLGVDFFTGGADPGRLGGAGDELTVHDVFQGELPAFAEPLALRQLDLIIGHFSPMLDFPQMRVSPLFDEPGASIVRDGHPLVSVKNIDWPDCLKFPHVSTVKYKTYAPYFAEGLPAGAEQILTTVRTSDMDFARTLVEEEDFVALASPLVFRPELRSGRFVTLPLARRYRSACSVAVSNEAAHFPVVRGIVELARQGVVNAGLELL